MLPGRLPPFGSLLRELRRAAGLTQEELAERARVGVRTLRDLETGRTARPQRSTVDLLAVARDLDETERKDFVVASRGWPGATRIARTPKQADPPATAATAATDAAMKDSAPGRDSAP
jgi:transcriptional regulator with XRE-family HTH domain